MRGKCTSCGAIVTEGDRYCNSCGYAFDIIPSKPPNAPVKSEGRGQWDKDRPEARPEPHPLAHNEPSREPPKVTVKQSPFPPGGHAPHQQQAQYPQYPPYQAGYGQPQYPPPYGQTYGYPQYQAGYVTPYGAYPYMPFPYPYSPYRRPEYAHVYGAPEKFHRIRLDRLKMVLSKPSKVFQELYHETGKNQGLVLGLTFIFLSALVSTIGTYMAVQLHGGNWEMFGPGSSEYFLRLGIITNLLSIPVNILIWLAFSWLTARFTRTFFNGRADFDKTLGFFGYTYVIGFVGSLISAVFMVGGVGSTTSPGAITDVGAPNFQGNICLGQLFMYILMIGVLLWSALVNSHAVSVANDVSVGEGFGAMLVAAIIVGIISGFVALILTFGLLLQGLPPL